MNVTIVGGGKVGYYLAKTLIEHHHDPTIIDIDKKNCTYLANELDVKVICGDGTQIETLNSADVKNSDSIVCVTGKDEDNLIACQLAKKIFNVKKTVAKVNNPKNASVMKSLGVDNVINSTDSIASLIEREVDTSKIKQLISLNHGESSIIEIALPDNYALDGVMLRNIKIPNIYNIVSITRKDELIIPRGQSELKSGDKLLVISQNNAIHQIRNVLKI